MQEFERQKIADAMEPKKFQDGDMIIEQVTYPNIALSIISAHSILKCSYKCNLFRVILKPIISILLWTVKSDLLFVTSPVKNKKSR